MTPNSLCVMIVSLVVHLLTPSDSTHILTYSLLPSQPVTAIHSISTGTPFGSAFTQTQLLAGTWKYFSYTPFISTKSPISVKNTLTFTTCCRFDAAADKIASIFLMHCSVFCAREPEMRLPEASAGIWPET